MARSLTWDRADGVGAEGVAAFMSTLATKLVLLRRDPESKGIVERRNGWFD